MPLYEVLVQGSAQVEAPDEEHALAALTVELRGVELNVTEVVEEVYGDG